MPKMKEILSKYWCLLLLDQDASEVLPHRPLITYKKGRSLKDRLVMSHFISSLGSFRCGNCSFTSILERTREFISSTTGKRYLIQDYYLSIHRRHLPSYLSLPNGLHWQDQKGTEKTLWGTPGRSQERRSWHPPFPTYEGAPSGGPKFTTL